MECCYFDTEEYEYEYKIIITKFRQRINSSEYQITLKSSTFTTGVHNRITWRVEVPLNVTQSSYGDSVQFNLVFIESQHPDVICYHIVYLLNVDGEIVKAASSYFAKVPVPTNENGTTACTVTYLKESITDNSPLYLPNDELTVVFKIFVKADFVINPLLAIKSCDNSDEMSDFAKLYNDQEFSDIIIQVANKKYFAHKLLLIARSEVFAAMFRHNMEEAENNMIEIDDVAPEIFEKLLQYIYTNAVEDLDEIALDLLPVADKYALRGLKKMCANSLQKNLTIDNAAETYILADRHHAEELMEYTKNFMKIHIGQVIKTPGYVAMEKDYPQCAMLIYKSFVSEIQNVPQK